MKPVPVIKGLEIDLAEKSLIDGGFGKYLPAKEARVKKERDFYLFVSTSIFIFLVSASFLMLPCWH